MKWRNKGHEFDNIGEILKKIDNIYIYGAGKYGEQLGRLFQGVGASYTYIDIIRNPLCIKINIFFS